MSLFDVFMTFWLHFGDFWTPKCTSFCTCGAKGPPEGTDGAIWRQNGVQKVPNGAPKVLKWSPKVPNGAQRCQHGVKKAAQRAQMIPKVLTCGQIVRHWGQNGPMVPKWCQHGTKMEPKWCQSGAKAVHFLFVLVLVLVLLFVLPFSTLLSVLILARLRSAGLG